MVHKLFTMIGGDNNDCIFQESILFEMTEHFRKQSINISNFTIILIRVFARVSIS